MKKMMRRFVIVGIILVLLLVGLGAYLFFQKRGDPHELVLFGNVDVRQVDIAFRVKGRVQRLLFWEGDFVKQGSKMAILEEEPYSNQVGEAKSRVESIQYNLKNTETLLKRQMEIICIGGVSEQELDDTQTKYNQLKADLEGANENLAIAIDNLSYTEVFAPSDGIILTRIMEEGSVVQEGQPVFTLSLTNPIWVRAYLTEPFLGRVNYGDPAKIYTDMYKGRVFEGRVGFISPIAEFTPKTVQTQDLRTDLVYRIRIYVDNPDNSLKQGMPVTVRMRI